MSISAQPLGEAAIGGQPAATAANPTKTPDRRKAVAKADASLIPEAR